MLLIDIVVVGVDLMVELFIGHGFIGNVEVLRILMKRYFLEFGEAVDHGYGWIDLRGGIMKGLNIRKEV